MPIKIETTQQEGRSDRGFMVIVIWMQAYHFLLFPNKAKDPRNLIPITVCSIIYIYIYRLHRVFVAAHGLSLVAASGGYSSCMGFSLQWLILWILDSRAFGLQQLWCMGLVTSQHVESSWTRDQTCVPCIGRWILNHLTTRKVLFYNFSMVELHDFYWDVGTSTVL